MYSSLVFFSVISLISASDEPRRLNFLETGVFGECEGKDSGNYTYVAQYSENQLCTIESFDYPDFEWLILIQGNGQKVVNTLKILARSAYPAGAYYHEETLYLVQFGNLEAKYLYIKEVGLRDSYLKKCSSSLGSTYVSTKTQTLLIADKLELPILLNPTGASDPFAKTASTICKGKSIIV